MSTATLTSQMPTTPRSASPAGLGIGKLLSYEWRRTGKLLGAVYGVAFLMWLLSISIHRIAALSDLSFLLVVVAGMALGFGVTLMLVIDYWRSAHSRMGYLTHLLPVKGSTQYLVRWVHGSVILGISGIVAFVMIASTISYFEPGLFTEPGFGQALKILADSFGGLWWVYVCALLLPFTQIGSLYFMATMGSKGPFGRMGIGGPIVMYFIVNIAMQVIAGLGMLIPIAVQLIYLDGGRLGTKLVRASSLFDANASDVPLMPFVFSGLASIVMIVWTARSWDRSIELP